MKVKVKFDLKKVQEFLLQNVEKIVLGAVVFVFLMMLYSALATAGRFDKTPEQLQTQAANGRREMEATIFEEYVKEKNASRPPEAVGTTPAPASSGLVMVDYVDQAKRSRDPIAEKPYISPVVWDPPLFERRPLRDAPPLFAVQQLRGTAGVGAFSMAIEPVADSGAERTDRAGRTEDREGGAERPAARPGGLKPPGGPGFATMGMAGGSDSIRGQRWVVLTGLVPIEKQEAAYAETFKQSPGYTQDDYPMYSAYSVQRVEAASADEAANPDWTKAKEFISYKAVEAAMRQWPQAQGGDVVGPEYLDEKLVFPLGPLVNREWDVSTAHEPEIPMLKSDERGGQGPGGMLGPGMRGPGMPGMGGDRMFGGPRGAMPGMDLRGAPGALGGRDGEGADNTAFDKSDPDAADKARKNATETDNTPEEKKAPAYKLFRFFDFNVEPGKQYVYRVRLALRNPNSGVKSALLKKPELAAEKYLITKWSEPSPMISVPRDTRVLTVSVKPARGANEPSGRILAIRWAKRKGVEIYEEFPVARGQVANFADVVGKIVGGVRQGQSNSLKANFNSDVTVVDLRGGDRIAGGRKGNDLKAAGEILLLDSDGNLIVRNELDDLPGYEQATAAPEPTGPEMGGPGDRMMPGMPGPGIGGPPGLGPRGMGLDTLEGPAKKKAGKMPR